MNGIEEQMKSEPEITLSDEVKIIDEKPIEVVDVEKNVEKEKAAPINFAKLFSEPPVRMNTLSKIDDYVDAVINLSKTNLHMDKVFVFKKNGENFETVASEGLTQSNYIMDENDPIYRSVLAKHKSIDITGDLKSTRYLKERIPYEHLENLAELFIVPVIKDNSVDGVAMFGRNYGSEEATNIQKYELYNIGFLHDD